jgi:hypothetical protein
MATSRVYTLAQTCCSVASAARFFASYSQKRIDKGYERSMLRALVFYVTRKRRQRDAMMTSDPGLGMVVTFKADLQPATRYRFDYIKEKL